MNVRAIALALPLVLGIAACKTSSTQGSGQTASTEPSQTGQNQTTTSPDRPEADAGATASGTATTDSPTASGSVQGGVSGDTSGTLSGTAEATPHSDDETVTGKVTSITESSVAIQSDMGEEKLLELVPQTMVKVDGQDASRMDLKEGQEVRASFNKIDGRDVAVQIEALESAGSTGAMPGDTTGTGTTGTETPDPAGSTGTSPMEGTTPTPEPVK
jgi:Cu/Ag efflux protein CusF